MKKFILSIVIAASLVSCSQSNYYKWDIQGKSRDGFYITVPSNSIYKEGFTVNGTLYFPVSYSAHINN